MKTRFGLLCSPVLTFDQYRNRYPPGRCEHSVRCSFRDAKPAFEDVDVALAEGYTAKPRVRGPERWRNRWCTSSMKAICRSTT